MNLFKTLDNVFRPEQLYMNEYKQKADELFNRFIETDPNKPGFTWLMDELDNLLSYLVTEFNYHPAWEGEYDRLCDEYFEPMKIKTE